MARGQRTDYSLRPSLLDRLIDNDPEREQDEPQSENQILRDIQISVRRDIEDLLNTRFRCAVWPPQFNGLEDSLINYGLPDFTAAGLNIVNDNELLTRSIEDAISRFEPRLCNVKVERVRGVESIDRTFRFRILGTLQLESVEQEIRFDSSLETISGQIEIK